MKIIILLCLFSINSLAATRVIDSNVSFIAVGTPSFLKIKGESKISNADLQIVNNKLNAQFVVDLKDITTGIDLRDKHHKEKYLEVSKYEKAKLTLTDVDVPKGDSVFKVLALLELHGEEKEITLIGEFKNNDDSLVIDTKFTIMIDDFKISTPSFQGITVAKKVKISVTTKLKK